MRLDLNMFKYLNMLSQDAGAGTRFAGHEPERHSSHVKKLLALPLVLAAVWTASSCTAGTWSTLHGDRYCEILAVTGAQDSGAAEVWNTMGLNDCPQEAWDLLDLEAVKADLGADEVETNGPRHWVLDYIVPGQLSGSLEVRNLDGIEMRSIATVDFTGAEADSTAYVELPVSRETTFAFLPGREIYELTAPDGSTYVMQSYSQELDPDQTLDDLASLGDRLDLPDGWSFTSRVLGEALLVEDLYGIATVVTDDLRNTYQLVAQD